ncbi:transcriptional regulator [Blastomonas natatoria]|uniref:Transcriptional regulator n=1 Tax=Blastomonas natatoria TaxID=34015 RepID=A0A2V3V9I4_9SPHN|nr:response regulator transcription factor [Blastomonas natatoria]PXW78482.1 transcriptional regulator [Blastomonas natatoria]
MKQVSNPAPGGAPHSQNTEDSRWLLAGSDSASLERLALMLTRFGVDTQPYSRDPAMVRHRRVVCDARDRKHARLWAAELSARSAPLLFVGVRAAFGRASLIDAGAADALCARIAPGELAARLRAADRLHAAQQGLVRLAGFEFDVGLRQARWQGMALALMPREFDLLLALARQFGSVVSRDDLLRAVWRTAFDPGTNSVEVHICKLRRSLSVLEGSAEIETVRHGGYRLV